MRKRNLSGKTFGKLTVIEQDASKKVKKTKWLCTCSCGNTRSVFSTNLIRGLSRSCGECLQRGMHGLASHPLYKVWHTMLRRCYNPKHVHFDSYGGRGINCDSEWLQFENFYADMHLDYRKGLQLDRIDNNGSYCKSNCRWVTCKENANNKRTNRKIEYEGIMYSMAQLAQKLGIKYRKFRYEMQKYSYNIELALKALD